MAIPCSAIGGSSSWAIKCVLRSPGKHAFGRDFSRVLLGYRGGEGGKLENKEFCVELLAPKIEKG